MGVLWMVAQCRAGARAAGMGGEPMNIPREAIGMMQRDRELKLREEPHPRPLHLLYIGALIRVVEATGDTKVMDKIERWLWPELWR